jgi:GT2 family glycosyltransferase
MTAIIAPTRSEMALPAVSPVDLSIVIVSWNTREILRDCLASVVANAGGLVTELFVVDNASSDGSAEMVHADFPSAKLIRNEQNRGFAAANNQALRIAHGRQVLLLNSDTLILDDVLEKSVRYMNEHPDVGIMGCRVLNPNRTLQPTCFEFPNFLNLFLVTFGLARLPWPRFFGKYRMTGWKRDCERDVDVVTGCCMFVRHDAMREIGFLDESFFFFGEETDWCKRFEEEGWGVRFAPVGDIVHYGGASAKQLNHRRDILLIGALVDFNRKHGGKLIGYFVWALLWISNVMRYLGFLVVSIFDRKGSTSRRRDHFRNILKDFPALGRVEARRATARA